MNPWFVAGVAYLAALGLVCLFFAGAGQCRNRR